MKEIIKIIQDENIGKIVENASLKNYTTYKVGGIARAIVSPKDEKKLICLLKLLRERNIPYKILGNGSNVLFSDKPYHGIIIKLDAFMSLEFHGTTVKVGAGYPLMRLSSQTARKSLSGLEFAGGIPGTVGGAIYMNAGAYKSDMGYIVKEIKVLTKDLNIITMKNSELDFHYRSSILQKRKDDICLEATLKLKKASKNEIEQVNRDRRFRRIQSQPLEYPSAGSTFRNPEGNFAGKLIEDLGLKGKMIGGAMVSEKHANFIINKENASAKDIKDLIEYVKEEVKINYNITLYVEQEFVNWE